MLKHLITLLLLIALMGIWKPLEGQDDGNFWVFEDMKTGEMIGTCRYSYMRVGGVEQWIGTFFHQHTDFQFNPYTTQGELEGLYSCVMWVESFALGGYYI